MNDVSILGDIPNEKSNEMLLQIIDGDTQIMNLASSCYWTVVIFSLAHEVAHSYFASIGEKFPNRKKEEFELWLKSQIAKGCDLLKREVSEDDTTIVRYRTIVKIKEYDEDEKNFIS